MQHWNRLFYVWYSKPITSDAFMIKSVTCTEPDFKIYQLNFGIFFVCLTLCLGQKLRNVPTQDITLITLLWLELKMSPEENTWKREKKDFGADFCVFGKAADFARKNSCSRCSWRWWETLQLQSFVATDIDYMSQLILAKIERFSRDMDPLFSANQNLFWGFTWTHN